MVLLLLLGAYINDIIQNSGFRPPSPSVKGLNHKIKTPKANHIQFSITNPTFNY